MRKDAIAPAGIKLAGSSRVCLFQIKPAGAGRWHVQKPNHNNSKMKPTILITAALFAFRAHGTPTTLDFEAPLPGGLVAATHSHLAPAPSSAVITTQYANDGVLFSGVVLLNLGSGHATSGVNALGGLDNQGRFNSGAPITLTFVSPTDGVTPATTDFFSVYTDLLADSDNSG